MSPLTAILEDDRHKDKMNLSEEDRRILYLWLDRNIQFYGVYAAAERLKRQNGEMVPVPNIQ